MFEDPNSVNSQSETEKVKAMEMDWRQPKHKTIQLPQWGTYVYFAFPGRVERLYLENGICHCAEVKGHHLMRWKSRRIFQVHVLTTFTDHENDSYHVYLSLGMWRCEAREWYILTFVLEVSTPLFQTSHLATSQESWGSFGDRHEQTHKTKAAQWYISPAKLLCV